MSKKVLIVDSDVNFATHATRIMAGLSLPASVCNRGAEAPAMFETLQPDLVILSVELLDQNGFMTYRRLRGISGGELVKVIITSSEKTEKDFDRHRKLQNQQPADVYLSKPVDADLLMKHASELLELDISTQTFDDALEAFGGEIDSGYEELNRGNNEKELLELKEQIEEKDRQLEYLNKEMGAFKAHLPGLQKSEKVLGETKKALESSNDRIAALEASLQEKETDDSKRKAELDDALSKLSELEQSLEAEDTKRIALEERIRTFETAAEEKESKIAGLNQDLEEVRKSLASTQEQLKEREGQLEEGHQERTKLQSTVEDLQENLEKSTTALGIETNRLSEAENTRREVEQNQVSLENEVRELKRTNQEMHGQQRANAEELEQLRRADSNHREELTRKKSEIETLNRELHAANERSKGDQAESANQIDRLQNKIDTLSKDLDQVRRDSDQEQKRIQQERDEFRDRYQTETADLEKQIEEWKVKHRDAENGLARVELLLSEAEKQVEDRTKELDRVRDTARENATRDMKHAREQHDRELENARKSLQSSIDDLRRQNDDWQNRYTKQSEELAAIKDVNRDKGDQQSARITQLEKQLASSERSLSKTGSRERDAEKFAIEIRSALNDLTGRNAQTDTADSDIAESGTILEQALRESRLRISELKDSSIELMQSQEKNKSFEKDIERLRLSNETLRNRLEQALKVLEKGLRELQGDTVDFEFEED